MCINLICGIFGNAGYTRGSNYSLLFNLFEYGVKRGVNE